MSDVVFTRKQAAQDLWEYGEDKYIDKVLHLSRKEIRHLQRLVDNYMSEQTLKLIGKNSTQSFDLGLMTAVTIVAYFEGKPRALTRKKRRNHRLMPKRL